jgi:hypothetical protein
VTAPSEGQGQGQQQGQQGAKNRQRPKRLAVVEYTHRDPILLGQAHQAVGVVTDPGTGDGAVTIRPLTHHSVTVDLGDVAGEISADDV